MPTPMLDGGEGEVHVPLGDLLRRQWAVGPVPLRKRGAHGHDRPRCGPRVRRREAPAGDGFVDGFVDHPLLLPTQRDEAATVVLVQVAHLARAHEGEVPTVRVVEDEALDEQLEPPHRVTATLVLRRSAPPEQVLHAEVEDGGQHLLLRRVVVVHAGHGEAGATGDVAHGRAVIAELDEHVQGGSEHRIDEERREAPPVVGRGGDRDRHAMDGTVAPRERSRRRSSSPRCTHFMASGLIGEPTPFVTLRGGAQKKNSQTPSAAQSAASSSRSRISPSVMPMSRISTMCTLKIASGSSPGSTSMAQLSEHTAATSRAWSHSQQSWPSPGSPAMNSWGDPRSRKNRRHPVRNTTMSPGPTSTPP